MRVRHREAGFYKDASKAPALPCTHRAFNKLREQRFWITKLSSVPFN